MSLVASWSKSDLEMFLEMNRNLEALNVNVAYIKRSKTVSWSFMKVLESN